MTWLTLLLAATPSPSPTLPASLIDEDLVTPTWVGFAITFLVAAAVIGLAIDLVRRVRRVTYRNEIRERLEAEAAENDPAKPTD